MERFDLWPSLTFLFSFFNLLNWYMKGEVLFSWWWLLPVAVIQLILAIVVLAVAAAIAHARR